MKKFVDIIEHITNVKRRWPGYQELAKEIQKDSPYDGLTTARGYAQTGLQQLIKKITGNIRQWTKDNG